MKTNFTTEITFMGIQDTALHVMFHMNQYASPMETKSFMKTMNDFVQAVKFVRNNVSRHQTAPQQSREWLPNSLDAVNDALKQLVIQGYARGEDGYRVINNLIISIDNSLKMVFDAAPHEENHPDGIAIGCSDRDGCIVLKKYDDGMNKAINYIAPHTKYIVVGEKYE